MPALPAVAEDASDGAFALVVTAGFAALVSSLVFELLARRVLCLSEGVLARLLLDARCGCAAGCAAGAGAGCLAGCAAADLGCFGGAAGAAAELDRDPDFAPLPPPPLLSFLRASGASVSPAFSAPFPASGCPPQSRPAA